MFAIIMVWVEIMLHHVSWRDGSSVWNRRNPSKFSSSSQSYVCSSWNAESFRSTLLHCSQLLIFPNTQLCFCRWIAFLLQQIILGLRRGQKDRKYKQTICTQNFLETFGILFIFHIRMATIWALSFYKKESQRHSRKKLIVKILGNWQKNHWA